MTDTSSQLNDVNLEAFTGLATKVTESPEVAETTWHAEVTWNGGFRSEAKIREFAPADSDEPIAIGGTDNGPNPVEQLLAALGNCLAIGYAANAAIAGIKIQNLRIEVSGDLNLQTFLGVADANAGFEQIQVTVHLDSDATAEQLAELHSKVTTTSPVGHTISRPVPVSIDLA